VRGVLVAALSGLMAALWTWTLPGDPALRTDAGGVPVLVLDNGFHTDLALPRAALEARPGPLAGAVSSLGPGEWILVGWGDAVFYVDQRPIESRLPDGARAFFRPGNPSVLMLDPHAGDPSARIPAARKRTLRLPAAAFDRLAAHVEATLAPDRGRARPVTPRPGDDARFFAARGHFWILNLCNSWAARTLNAAGLPVRPLRSVTSAEVLAAVDRFERAGTELDTRPGGD
jgi:uncharacterized protein (TIGR02117 family)